MTVCYGSMTLLVTLHVLHIQINRGFFCEFLILFQNGRKEVILFWKEKIKNEDRICRVASPPPSPAMRQQGRDLQELSILDDFNAKNRN